VTSVGVRVVGEVRGLGEHGQQVVQPAVVVKVASPEV